MKTCKVRLHKEYFLHTSKILSYLKMIFEINDMIDTVFPKMEKFFFPRTTVLLSTCLSVCSDALKCKRH